MTAIAVPIVGPLVPSRFINRHNRFLLQVELEGSKGVVDAHMADPGRLRELLLPDRRIWLRPASSPSRRTRWSAVLVESNRPTVESPQRTGLVSLDTALPNRLVRRALERGALPEVAGWNLVRTELPVGRSRLDFLMADAAGRQMAMEVKSVTLVEGGVALFPDAVTDRGARHVKHLEELARKADWEAAVLFVVQRSDAMEVRAARGIDPGFAEALESAKRAGLRILGRRCHVFLDRVELGAALPADVG
jgi:sugar fermentation stimulation protein A